LALQLSFQQGLSRQNANIRTSAVVFAVLHTLPLGSHPREKESADVADAGCQFISRASFQETVRLNVWQCDCWLQVEVRSKAHMQNQ